MQRGLGIHPRCSLHLVALFLPRMGIICKQMGSPEERGKRTSHGLFDMKEAILATCLPLNRSQELMFLREVRECRNKGKCQGTIVQQYNRVPVPLPQGLYIVICYPGGGWDNDVDPPDFSQLRLALCQLCPNSC